MQKLEATISLSLISVVKMAWALPACFYKPMFVYMHTNIEHLHDYMSQLLQDLNKYA